MASDNGTDEDGLVPATLGTSGAAEYMTGSTAFHAVLMDAMTDAMVVIDASSTIVEANAAAHAMFGFERDGLIGTHLRELQAPGLRARHAAAVDRYLDTGERTISWQAATVTARNQSGREFPVEISFGEFLERGDKRFVGIIRDVTERVRIEQQLRQAQKMEALGLLAGGIAHDFNNLLGAIIGYTDLAEAEVGPDHPARSDLSEIRGAAARASAMTSQLLAFSRRESMAPAMLDPAATLLSMVPLLGQLLGPHVGLVVDGCVQGREVRMDPIHFDQMLINLTTNARDAMPDGGTLTIRMVDRSSGIDGAEPDVASRGGWLELTVADTGEGMSAETLEHIFDPFFTTKDVGYGTGLGLATVHGVVRQAGGSITVESRHGAGSTFTILLPVSTSMPSQRHAITATRDRGRASTVLLVLDERADMAAAAALALQRSGCVVLTAKDGESAISLAERTATIDALVLGFTVGHESGSAIASAVSRTHPAVSIVYLAGPRGGQRVQVRAGDPAGRVLVTPFAVKDLLEVVERVLDERP